MTNQQNDEVAEWMRSLGFEWLEEDRRYKVLSHTWPDGTQAGGRGQYIHPELAEYLHRAHLAAVVEARKETNNYARYALHGILSDDVDRELTHSEIEDKFVAALRGKQ